MLLFAIVDVFVMRHEKDRECVCARDTGIEKKNRIICKKAKISPDSLKFKSTSSTAAPEHGTWYSCWWFFICLLAWIPSLYNLFSRRLGLTWNWMGYKIRPKTTSKHWALCMMAFFTTQRDIAAAQAFRKRILFVLNVKSSESLDIILGENKSNHINRRTFSSAHKKHTLSE